jgi:hypothetical protein
MSLVHKCAHRPQEVRAANLANCYLAGLDCLQKIRSISLKLTWYRLLFAEWWYFI